MKTLKTISALLLILSLSFGVKAVNYEDEKLNLPGDNLNLYAVMKLFQESETLEGFERELNAEDSRINNLDLNGNNLIDYIKVIDYVDGETHNIVLQVAINERENQDVAVITVYKDKRGQVQVQLVGDEYLYGKDYIIEPYYDENGYAETPNPGYIGNTKVVNHETVVVTRTTYVEVQAWPVVRYIYTPTYIVWRSPWYWGYYPSYWNPWRPYYWDYYYGYHSHWNHYYHGYYRHCNYYRYPRYTSYYYHTHRAYSPTVVAYRDNGRYKNTYSRPDLRQAGSNDYKKRYPNDTRTSARSTENTRSNQSVRQDATNNRSTQSAGRTTTTTRSSGTTNTGTRATKPESRQTTTGTSSRQNVNTQRTKTQESNSGKPAVRTTESRQPAAGNSSRQNVNTQRTQSQDRPSGKPAVRSSESRQPATGNSSRQNVNTQRTQSQDRPSGKPAVRSSDNKPARTGSSVKSSGNTSAKPAARTATQSQKSNTSEKSNKKGR